MNASSKITVMALMCLVCSTAFIAPAYAYDSSYESGAVLDSEINYISISGSSTADTDYSSDIANSGITGNTTTVKGKTTYTYSGTVSRDLFIYIDGVEDSRIGVGLSGSTPGMTVTFAFDGSEKIVLSSTAGWNGTTSKVYPSGSYVGFTVTISASNVTTRDPTLGSVTFTMVGNGSSVTVSSNPVTVSLVQIINDDSDVAKALGEINKTRDGKNGVTGTTSTGGKSAQTDFKFVENTADKNTNGVYITTGTDGNDVVNRNTSFKFDVKIPAGQKFCIRFDLSTAIIADNEVVVTATGEHTDISGSISLKSNILKSNTIYGWIVMGSDGPSLTSGTSRTCTAFDETVTLSFDGQRTAGWLTDGTLKIQIVMI